MTPTLLLDLDGTLVDTIPDLLSQPQSHDGGARTCRTLWRLSRCGAMIGDGAAVLMRRAMSARGRVATHGRPDRRCWHDYTAHVADGSRLYPRRGADVARHGRVGLETLRFAPTNRSMPARELALRRLGVLELFAAVGGGDSYRTRKPDPKPSARRRLRTPADMPSAAVMVGDHHNDMHAGREWRRKSRACSQLGAMATIPPAAISATAQSFPEAV